ncbi:MAG: HD-GYP domain-containing protein, partial [Halarsenatibacteraceae bacterium]
FIPAKTILNEEYITRIKELGYEFIYIIFEKEEIYKEDTEKKQAIDKSYKENTDRVKNLFNKVKRDKKIEYTEIKGLVVEANKFSSELDILDLVNMIRTADEYTFTHSLNVSILANMFSQWLNFDEKDKIRITLAGLLHDIGKAKIPDKILNKPASLSPEEFEEMKKHSIYGYEMLKDINEIPAVVKKAVITHHEHFNGDGYPLQLKSNKIPLFGRIIAIIDAFDAITANRVYKAKSSPFQAMEIFVHEETTHFDPALKEVFLAHLPNYFIKENVILNDGRMGEIVFINPVKPESPIVKVSDQYIDLTKEPKLKIKEIF